MMKTKLQLLLVTILMAFSLNVIAQNNSNYDKAKNITDKMTRELSLTQDQMPKIQSINEDYVRRAMDLRRQYSNNRTELERQIKENNAEREVQARKIFTERQYALFLQKKAGYGS